LRQSVVSPSEAFVRWTRGEMENHGRWIKRRLIDLSNEQRSCIPPAARITTSIQQHCVPWSSIEALARQDGRHGLVADPEPVFAFGRSQRLFWKARRQYGEAEKLYRLPNDTEWSQLSAWIASVPNVVLAIAIDDKTSPHALDRIALLQRGKWTVLAALVAAEIFVPVDLVTDEILPRLWLQLSQQFRAEVSKPLGYSHTHRVLKLANLRKTVPMPNLCASPWKERWESSRRIGEQNWQWLRDRSAVEVLLPDCLQRDKEGEFELDALWLEHVGVNVEKYSRWRVTCDETNFPGWFGGLGWQPLW
jgi:hypothetical protein